MQNAVGDELIVVEEDDLRILVRGRAIEDA